MSSRLRSLPTSRGKKKVTDRYQTCLGWSVHLRTGLSLSSFDPPSFPVLLGSLVTTGNSKEHPNSPRVNEVIRTSGVVTDGTSILGRFCTSGDTSPSNKCYFYVISRYDYIYLSGFVLCLWFMYVLFLFFPWILWLRPKHNDPFRCIRSTSTGTSPLADSEEGNEQSFYVRRHVKWSVLTFEELPSLPRDKWCDRGHGTYLISEFTTWLPTYLPIYPSSYQSRRSDGTLSSSSVYLNSPVSGVLSRKGSPGTGVKRRRMKVLDVVKIGCQGPKVLVTDINLTWGLHRNRTSGDRERVRECTERASGNWMKTRTGPRDRVGVQPSVKDFLSVGTHSPGRVVCLVQTYVTIVFHDDWRWHLVLSHWRRRCRHVLFEGDENEVSGFRSGLGWGEVGRSSSLPCRPSAFYGDMGTRRW